MKQAILLALVLSTGCTKPTEPSPVAPAVSRAPRLASPIDLVGRAAPAFSVDAVNRPGAKIVVPNGKVTVLVFVGSWSAGSTRALSQLDTLAKRFPGAEVLAVSVDETRASATEFGSSPPRAFAVGWDEAGFKVARQWSQGMYAENSVFVIDRKGVVRFAHLGGKEECPAGQLIVGDELEQLLAEN